MRPDRLDRWAGPTLALLALSLAGLLLAQSARGLPPPVVDPPDGGEGSARAGPRLTFEAPMVQASVESRLALAPDHPLTPPLSIGFAWQGNELQLTLAESLQPGSSYTLRLAPRRSTAPN
jgi:hypothetical protein